MKFKVGAALFINGASCSIYKGSKMDLDSWSSSLYKWALQLAIASWSSSLYKGSNFTVGAQHIHYISQIGPKSSNYLSYVNRDTTSMSFRTIISFNSLTFLSFSCFYNTLIWIPIPLCYIIILPLSFSPIIF